MEELTAARPPRRHRERRHRRKASDASFGDVIGEAPRFPGVAPVDYAEVFGGVAASCSIPYLDLPPPAAPAGGGEGRYGEIFARFDFGDFAAPYEDALAEPEEIGSPSGSSRSSIRESGQLDAEPSKLNKYSPDSGNGKNFGEEQFYPASSPPNGDQKFGMSYNNNSTQGRADTFVEMTACIVEPSISYVVDSCNFSNNLEIDHVPEIHKVCTLANGINGKVDPPNVASSSKNNADSTSVVDQLQHIPTCFPTTTAATKPTWVPISENICEDETSEKRSSTHSVSSEEAPSPDYPFLRLSNISIPVAPIKVRPPPTPPSKLLNKRENKENGDSVVDPNSAAAAMKKAMEFAEARLKVAKELMETKGDSFKPRKRPAHHRSTKSTEVNGSKIPEEVHLFEEKLSVRRFAKKENQNKDLPLLDDNRDVPAVKSVHRDPDKNVILSPGKPQEMPQNGNKLEELGKWTSDDEFYELITHDQRCRPNATPSEGNNGVKSYCTKLEHTDKEKIGGSVGELKRVRKLWDTTAQRRETASLVKDGTSSVDVEHQAPRPPEVPVCKEKATEGELTDIHFKQCLEMDIQGHDDDRRLEISSMSNIPAKVHADPEKPEKEKAGGFVGEPKKVRKLWDITGLKREIVNLLKDGTSSVVVEHEAPRLPEVPFFEESVAYQEPTNSHFKQCQGMESSLEGRDENGRFKISCMDNTPIVVVVQPDLETPSSFPEDSISGGWHDRENLSVASAEETPLVGKSNQANDRDEIMRNSATGPILYEHPNIPNIDEIKETKVKISDTKESVESHETCEKEKLFDFVYEANVQNESERENEETLRTIIHEEKNFRIAKNADANEDFQEGDLYQDAGSPEKIANINEDGGGKVHNVSVGHGKLMEANAITGGSPDKDPYQLKEPQGSLGSQDLENRTDIAEDIVSDGDEKEAKESMLESAEMTLVEELLNHASKECKNSIENSIHDSPEVYAEVNARSDRNGNMFDSVSEVISDDGSDYAAKMNARSTSLQVSFSEACTHVQHLFQNTGYSSAEKADKSTLVKNLLDEDFREADRGIPIENCTPVEGQNTGGKMGERDSEDRISNEGLKNQQFFHLDSDTIPKFAEDTASHIVHKLRDENLDVQRTNERGDVKYTEEKADEEEAHVRLDEEKEKEEKEWKIEKEKEDKERRSRELEEEKERELERAKDRLAVQRATREAHERAFAEARAKAERIALERITLARQRASAEAREREEKATAEAAAEKASREARLKAERSAVERATAEARERAIEKAKAAADAKGRMERFRSSFKDSSKTINQDNIQEKQFQKRPSNNQGRSMDSCNEVVKVESALRHKAKLEREQRTTERAAKALAEKNMRDMLAQREQAERHRLAEFLDPEVKRWSSGKEGNLRALLSTLQYILGADSGWQSVPLTDLITAAGVKKAYRRATLCVHPDKLQQRGATIRQKYICEKVFDLLKEAWNRYNSEER